MRELNCNIVFMGSPEYVIPVMTGLAKNFLLNGVVTQPDRQTGRNRIVLPTPVKNCANELGIDCIQPERLDDENFIKKLKTWNPDVVVVAAYGKIIPEKILHIPDFGFINVHASLLPRWRGASPIQAAILNGDERGGVTIMKIDKGLDTGPIISQCEVSINPDDTLGSLRTRLVDSGTKLLLETLPEYLCGKITPQPQRETGATYARMINKSDGELDLNTPAIQLERKVRAFNPWPICTIKWQNHSLRIFRVVATTTSQLKPGERGIIDRYPAIGTSTNDILLIKVQTPGKSVIDGKQFLNGARNWMI